MSAIWHDAKKELSEDAPAELREDASNSYISKDPQFISVESDTDEKRTVAYIQYVPVRYSAIVVLNLLFGNYKLKNDTEFLRLVEEALEKERPEDEDDESYKRRQVKWDSNLYAASKQMEYEPPPSNFDVSKVKSSAQYYDVKSEHYVEGLLKGPWSELVHQNPVPVELLSKAIDPFARRCLNFFTLARSKDGLKNLGFGFASFRSRPLLDRWYKVMENARFAPWYPKKIRIGLGRQKTLNELVAHFRGPDSPTKGTPSDFLFNKSIPDLKEFERESRDYWSKCTERYINTTLIKNATSERNENTNKKNKTDKKDKQNIREEKNQNASGQGKTALGTLHEDVVFPKPKKEQTIRVDGRREKSKRILHLMKELSVEDACILMRSALEGHLVMTEQKTRTALKKHFLQGNIRSIIGNIMATTHTDYDNRIALGQKGKKKGDSEIPSQSTKHDKSYNEYSQTDGGTYDRKAQQYANPRNDSFNTNNNPYGSHKTNSNAYKATADPYQHDTSYKNDSSRTSKNGNSKGTSKGRGTGTTVNDRSGNPNNSEKKNHHSAHSLDIDAAVSGDPLDATRDAAAASSNPYGVPTVAGVAPLHMMGPEHWNGGPPAVFHQTGAADFTGDLDWTMFGKGMPPQNMGKGMPPGPINPLVPHQYDQYGNILPFGLDLSHLDVHTRDSVQALLHNPSALEGVLDNLQRRLGNTEMSVLISETANLLSQ